MPNSINDAYLAHLRVIVADGWRPAVWHGIGPDRAVPEKAARRLEDHGLIRRVGDRWEPTVAGLRKMGRAI